MNAIKKGDVVCLRSGGPNMTVISVDEAECPNYPIYVFWFNPDGTKQKDCFPLEAVVRVETA